MELEHKTLELTSAELKAGARGHGRLQGYAATFGNKDRAGDIIMPGAFDDTIPFMLTDGFAAYGHDHDNPPIGTFDVIRDDGVGLWVEMDFHSTPRAQEARVTSQERLERKKSVKMSIAFQVMEGGSEYTDDARLLKRLQVFEAGIVNIPANPAALVAGVKDALVAEVSFDDRVSALVSGANEVTQLAMGMHAVRLKENRVLSTANRGMLNELHGALSNALVALAELLATTEPPAKEAVSDRDGSGGGKEKPKGKPSKSLRHYRRLLDQQEKWAIAHSGGKQA